MAQSASTPLRHIEEPPADDETIEGMPDLDEAELDRRCDEAMDEYRRGLCKPVYLHDEHGVLRPYPFHG